MRKLLLGIIFILFTTVANAGALATLTNNPQDRETAPDIESQQEPVLPEILYLPSIVDCGAPHVILDIIERFEEIPFLEGETVIKRPDGVVMSALMTMFLNNKTGSYSLVARFPGNRMWCIINSGGKVKPSVSKKST